MLEPFPAKPKGMHRRTFRRLRARAEAACRLRDCSPGASSNAKSVFQDDAVTPRGFKFSAHPCRLFRRRERTDKSSIVCPCGPKVGAANDRLLATKLARVFRSQRTERGLGPAFTALGRNLHRIALCEGRVRHCCGRVCFGLCERRLGVYGVCATRLTWMLRHRGSRRWRWWRISNRRYACRHVLPCLTGAWRCEHPRLR